ncbi:hypothetical protein Golax_005834, partial [Gossypium laxum]|nr:hypothetical protein [Gossypium laxum]
MERVQRGVGSNSSCPLCSHDTEDILHVLHECSAAKEYERNLYGDKSNVHISSPLSTLSENLLYLFTDGAIEQGSRATPAGGVLLDQNRNLIFDYNRFLGKCNIFDAELRGIVNGMIMSLNNGFNRVVIHTDNLEVVQALQDNLLGDLSITILKRVQEIMSTEGRWLIQHVPKKITVLQT